MQWYCCFLTKGKAMSLSSLTQKPRINLARIAQLVLREHPDWHTKRIDTAIQEYLCFLQLCKMFPEDKIAAPADIDSVWHAHILDSVYYIADCQDYFGYYLHHDPCIGESDKGRTQSTLALYQETFGAPPDMWLALMTCANPGGGCGSITALHA